MVNVGRLEKRRGSARVSRNVKAVDRAIRLDPPPGSVLGVVQVRGHRPRVLLRGGFGSSVHCTCCCDCHEGSSSGDEQHERGRGQANDEARRRLRPANDGDDGAGLASLCHLASDLDSRPPPACLWICAGSRLRPDRRARSSSRSPTCSSTRSHLVAQHASPLLLSLAQRSARPPGRAPRKGETPRTRGPGPARARTGGPWTPATDAPPDGVRPSLLTLSSP